MREIAVHETEIDGLPVAWRSAPPAGDVPVLWVHGVPDSGALWTPFLEHGGGLAPDLPGFGRSGKPAGFGYSIAAYGAWLERFLDSLGVERVALVAHDWGAAALAFAQRHPDRIARLVLVNALPLLPGYRWHRLARLWRTRLAGELAMGFTSPRAMRIALRSANSKPLPPGFVEGVFAHFDHGTQRAILRLYRSAGPEDLAAAGSRLHVVDAPALVVWGARDPFLPEQWADAYTAALPNAECVRVEGGHWPWVDEPSVVPLVAGFAAGCGGPAKPVPGAS